MEDFAASFDERGVTWSMYRSFRQVVDEDPDCSTDNPMFSMVDHPGIGEYLTPGNPIHFGAAERIPPGRAPLLGEHTEAILAEAGFADGEIAALHDDGIVASAKA